MNRTSIVARAVAAGIAFGAVAAGPVALAGNSAADGEKGGSICGTVWYDQNEDGFRQPAEKPIPFHVLRVDGQSRFAVSDFNGHYCFRNLPEGDYVLKSGDRARIDQRSWTYQYPGGSSFDHVTGLGDDYDGWNHKPIKIVKQDGGYTHIENFDSGFLTPRVDLEASQVLFNPMSGPWEGFKVGDVLVIQGSVANDGNAPEYLGGTVTLPEGLTILETNSNVPSRIEGQRIIADADGRIRENNVHFIGARVRVDKVLTGAPIKVEVHKGLFRDTNPDNNVLVVPFTTTE